VFLGESAEVDPARAQGWKYGVLGGFVSARREGGRGPLAGTGTVWAEVGGTVWVKGLCEAWEGVCG